MGVISRAGNANTQRVIWGGRARSKNRSPGWAEESCKGMRCWEETERKEDQERAKREVTRVPAATLEAPVFLPGESQGWGSLMGCRLWGGTESDTTDATQQQ